jgi:predicted nucleic acid-binding protein
VSRVFWDTNLFIYLFEDSPRFGPKVVALRQKMLKRGDELLTSTLTLGEVLVKPMAHERVPPLHSCNCHNFAAG